MTPIHSERTGKFPFGQPENNDQALLSDGASVRYTARPSDADTSMTFVSD